MNYVIANITDERVIKGERYPIISMHEGMVDIKVNEDVLCINAEDKDFTICLNNNQLGCDCCEGDAAVYWGNDKNNAFVDKNGKMLITVDGKIIEFNVEYCPTCGRKFY